MNIPGLPIFAPRLLARWRSGCMVSLADGTHVLSRLHAFAKVSASDLIMSPVGLAIGRLNSYLLASVDKPSPWLTAAKAAGHAISVHGKAAIPVISPWLNIANAAGAPVFAHYRFITTVGDFVVIAFAMFIMARGSQMLMNRNSFGNGLVQRYEED